MPRLALPSLLHSLLEGVRQRLRGSDLWFIALALLVGLMAGELTVLQSRAAHGLQRWLYGLEAGEQLSAAPEMALLTLLALPIGGLVVGLLAVLANRLKRPLIDAVEANALHGGRMSMRDNLIILFQTLVSNGSGASVGLEASYTQMGSGTGSKLGIALRLRRADVRILVGAGAAGAIAAAFGAPLAGAFYAFEIVIGAYTPAALAPIALASLAGAFVANQAGMPPYLLPAASVLDITAVDFALYGLLGGVCALLGIAIMRLIASIEGSVRRGPIPLWGRPVIGGMLLVPLALVTPQVLSSGHGALHSDLIGQAPLLWIAALLAMKCLASAISLGFGFRGGLFFASLFMGTLTGSLFSGLFVLLVGVPVVDSTSAALAGMAALAAAVVGAPMTMAMLVLEGTHNFLLASAVMCAVLVSSTLVRHRFGYSFSTWRMHLRGEAIRSARDIGWVRNLSAADMMRKGVSTAMRSLDVATFRSRFPLGSGTRVVLVDEDERYAGLVQIARLYADGVQGDAVIGDYAISGPTALPGNADVLKVMQHFDRTQTDEAAVIDADGRVLGVLSEAFVRKRYAEELDKVQRELMGERVDENSIQRRSGEH